MSEIPRHWRLRKQRYGLVGEVCPHCDHKMFPPRDVCPNCKREDEKKPIPQTEIAISRVLQAIVS